MTPDRSISELFAQKRSLRSLEFFPPKDEAGVEALRATATALKRMNPDFVSVTYGAGGTTRDRTAQVCAMLKNDFGFTVMPHLTCVGHSRAELGEIADRIHAGGFRNIMTLRGDPPKGATEFKVAAEGLRNASELVSLLKSRQPQFCLGVGERRRSPKPRWRRPPPRLAARVNTRRLSRRPSDSLQGSGVAEGQRDERALLRRSGLPPASERHP
jgi:methylenetetrahydrofolate reductase (NADPH)